MVADRASSISVRGDGNIVAGRDVNIGSTLFSIEEVPPRFRDEFQKLEKDIESPGPIEAKRSKVRKFAQDLTVAGFGSVSGAVIAHLLALI